MNKLLPYLFFAFLCLTSTLRAQTVGLKTNLLYDATATLNAGVEFGLSPHWTIDLSGNYNPWTFSDNRKWKHWLVQPELRYWLRHSFHGHFMGLHSGWLDYNIGGVELPGVSASKTSRYEGYATGMGLTYGYAWKLAGRLSLEVALGVGWVYTRYDRFRCARCGALEEKGTTANRFMPTKAALSLVYVVGKKPAAGRGSHETVKQMPQEALVHLAELQARDTERRAVQAEQQNNFLKEHLLRPELMEQQARLQEREAALAFLSPSSDKEVLILFPSGTSDLDTTYAGNDSVLTKLVSAIALLYRRNGAYENLKIEITGYASPDGKGALNRQLSEERMVALKNYLCRELPALSNDLFSLRAAGENWEGVRRWVAARPDMKYRDEVLRIIDRVPVDRGRKKRLMDLKWGRPYVYLSEHCFPTLRNACVVVVRVEPEAP